MPDKPQDVRRIHEMRHLVHEDVFYPPHAPRTESEEYRAVHHQLVVVEDSPCFICGLRNSQLADPTLNTSGVKEMETHHRWVEWALAGAVDPDKLKNFFTDPIDDVAAFVDHHRDNLMVLCDRHHRHREVGIHELTYPIWVAQKFVREDYQLTSGDGPLPQGDGQ